MQVSVWIGRDSREPLAWDVADMSFRRSMLRPVPVYPINLDDQRRAGSYWRQTEIRPPVVDGGRDVLWDVISEAPMATEFAITRFLTPLLARAEGQTRGWAIFADCDVLVRHPFRNLVDLLDPRYAAMCVKHAHVPREITKMRGEIQLGEIDVRAAGRYTRKNWSSVVAYNLDHPANRRLTIDLVNSVPGRDLHRFCWLEDDDIGALPATWNYLVGVPSVLIGSGNANATEYLDKHVALAHFTDGLPYMEGYEKAGHPAKFYDEWWKIVEDLREGRSV